MDKERTDTAFGAGGGGGGKKKRSGGGGGGGGGLPVPPPPPVGQSRPSQPVTHTKGSKEQLCIAFNAGNCGAASVAGGKCPTDPSKRHLCHWCLGTHPGSRCDPAAATKAKHTTKSTRSGKGGKKGGGKKGDGK